MKTPMQILLEKIENGDFIHPKSIGEFIKYNLLEKERYHCEYFAFKFRHESFTLKDIQKEYDAVFNYKDQEYYKSLTKRNENTNARVD